MTGTFLNDQGVKQELEILEKFVKQKDFKGAVKYLKEKFSDVLEDPVMEEIMNVACKLIEKDIS